MIKNRYIQFRYKKRASYGRFIYCLIQDWHSLTYGSLLAIESLARGSYALNCSLNLFVTCQIKVNNLHSSMSNSCSGSAAVLQATSSVWQHEKMVPFLSHSSLLATQALKEQKAGFPGRNLFLKHSFAIDTKTSQG